MRGIRMALSRGVNSALFIPEADSGPSPQDQAETRVAHDSTLEVPQQALSHGRLFPFQAARSMRSIGLRSNLARNLPDSTGRIFPLPESALTSGVHDKDRDAAEKDEDRADDCAGAAPLRSGGDGICGTPVEQCSKKHQQELGDD